MDDSGEACPGAGRGPESRKWHDYDQACIQGGYLCQEITGLDASLRWHDTGRCNGGW
ncbi:MAG: hypothetical protein Q8P59_06525 [Dehalococcoidia bacterium]|nr:hypothetical protein [Dehalococcoidia bacterium]